MRSFASWVLMASCRKLAYSVHFLTQFSQLTKTKMYIGFGWLVTHDHH